MSENQPAQLEIDGFADFFAYAVNDEGDDNEENNSSSDWLGASNQDEDLLVEPPHSTGRDDDIIGDDVTSPYVLINGDDLDTEYDRLVEIDPRVTAKFDKFQEIYSKGVVEYQALQTGGGTDDSPATTTNAAAGSITQLFDEADDGKNEEHFSSVVASATAVRLAKLTLIELDRWSAAMDADLTVQRQKFYELFQNLKRENNKELRIKIVKGEITVPRLVGMDAKDLAPEALKRRREEEAEKYFKEQVIVKDDPTASIIRKTHKGIEAINPLDTAVKFSGTNKEPQPDGSGPQNDRSSRTVKETGDSDLDELDLVPWSAEFSTEFVTEFATENIDGGIDGESAITVPPRAKRLRGEDSDMSNAVVGFDADHVSVSGGGMDEDALVAGGEDALSNSPLSAAAGENQMVNNAGLFRRLSSRSHRGWEEIEKVNPNIMLTVKLARIPPDPQEYTLHKLSQRIRSRLQWLNENVTRRFNQSLTDQGSDDESKIQTIVKTSDEILKAVQRFQSSVDSHEHNLNDSSLLAGSLSWHNDPPTANQTSSAAPS